MKSVGTPELQQMINRGRKITLINTLPANRFPLTKIPASENVPLADEDFVDHVAQLAGGREQTVVVYSADSACELSTQAAAKLEEAGFSDVYDYTGGARAWQASGGVLVPPAHTK